MLSLVLVWVPFGGYSSFKQQPMRALPHADRLGRKEERSLKVINDCYAGSFEGLTLFLHLFISPLCDVVFSYTKKSKVTSVDQYDVFSDTRFGVVYAFRVFYFWYTLQVPQINDPSVVDFYEACILRVPLGDLLASPVNKSVGHIFGQIMKSGTVLFFVVLWCPIKVRIFH